MTCPHSPFALALCTALAACTAAVNEDPSAGASAGAPVQLAQYPGAPFEDRSGNLWFTTVLAGLIRYDGRQFVSFTTDDGLASNAVRDIIEVDDGVLLIGTTGGVSSYDGESFTTLGDYVDTPVTYTFAEHGDHRDVWDILKDSMGDLWIATCDGVFRHDGTAFVPFPLPVIAGKPSFEFTPKMVYCIYEDRDGVLWFGTDGAGAVSYDGTDMVVYTAEDGLCSDRICTILQDGRGDFWFGTSGGGVSRYDGSTFTTHLRSATFSEHTGWGRFMDILEDRAGNVWFGVSASGGGIYRFDGQDFRFFSKAEGLGEGGVPSLSEDRSGNLWLGTTAGVYRFDGDRFVNFTRGG
ncbi:MAG TPA: two-component regulator propeller domain-containing protein [Planctomycetota bacterium]|nr:two-component regulator propeller domain-containing protein [Planctomycetota bacterium]